MNSNGLMNNLASTYLIMILLCGYSSTISEYGSDLTISFQTIELFDGLNKSIICKLFVATICYISCKWEIL